jgi:hypothetical protein
MASAAVADSATGGPAHAAPRLALAEPGAGNGRTCPSNSPCRPRSICIEARKQSKAFDCRFLDFIFDFYLQMIVGVRPHPWLVARPEDWPWSSAEAHLAGRDEALVETAPLAALVPDWPGLLVGGLDGVERDRIRAHERTGRPLGDAGFVRGLKHGLRRSLARRKPGPKPHRDEG